MLIVKNKSPSKRQDKWAVYGEYGGYFTNLKDAKKSAKEASNLSDDKRCSVWLIADGCCYIDYEDGKLARDGWTVKKADYGL